MMSLRILATILLICCIMPTSFAEMRQCTVIGRFIECTIYMDNIQNKTRFTELIIKPWLTLGYHNEMNTIRNKQFAEWKNLVVLLVDSCYMPHFTDQIKGLSNIKELAFKSCKIQTLAKDAIADAWQLREVDLRFNEITQIPDNFFKHNQYINVLQLGFNQISRICELINHIDYLEILDFEGNLLEEMPTDYFDYYPTFEEIHVGGNNLLIDSSKNLFTARGFWGMHTLDLHNSRLVDISFLNMSLFPTMQYLYLSDNKLTYIPVEQFKKMPYMQELDLSNNWLIEIPHEAFSTMKNLKRLQLMNNPIFKIDVEKIMANKPNLWVLNMFRIMCNTIKYSVLEKFKKMQYKIEYNANQWCHTGEADRCESTVVINPNNTETTLVISEVLIDTRYDYEEWWTDNLNGILCYDDCGHNFKIFNGSYHDMEQITSITVLYQFDKLKKQMMKYLSENQEVKDPKQIFAKLDKLYNYFNATSLFTKGYL